MRPHAVLHVVGAFRPVPEQRIAIRDQPGEEAIKVAAHVASAFSWISRLAEVWRTNAVNTPSSTPLAASHEATSGVISTSPRRPGVWITSVVDAWRIMSRCEFQPSSCARRAVSLTNRACVKTNSVPPSTGVSSTVTRDSPSSSRPPLPAHHNTLGRDELEVSTVALVLVFVEAAKADAAIAADARVEFGEENGPVVGAPPFADALGRDESGEDDLWARSDATHEGKAVDAHSSSGRPLHCISELESGRFVEPDAPCSDKHFDGAAIQRVLCRANGAPVHAS